MRSDTFDQQRELRMKEGRGRVRGRCCCRRWWWWEEKDLGMREWLGLRLAVIMKVEGAGNKCDDADDKRDAAAVVQNDDQSVRVRGPAVDISCWFEEAQFTLPHTPSARRQRHDSHKVKSLTMGRPLVEIQRYYKREL